MESLQRSFKFQLAKSERNIKFLREAIKKEGLAIAAEKAALEKLQAADDSQSNDEQRSNQWDVSLLIHFFSIF